MKINCFKYYVEMVEIILDNKSITAIAIITTDKIERIVDLHFHYERLDFDIKKKRIKKWIAWLCIS